MLAWLIAMQGVPATDVADDIRCAAVVATRLEQVRPAERQPLLVALAYFIGRIGVAAPAIDIPIEVERVRRLPDTVTAATSAQYAARMRTVAETFVMFDRAARGAASSN
ncbi:hypothetical protein [Sphingomonas sp. VNH70]|uniref:hypothetical protein n=1 Tax=Sphingomonas silueang TaxID=3156617 RepID=UPI0032B55D25